MLGPIKNSFNIDKTKELERSRNKEIQGFGELASKCDSVLEKKKKKPKMRNISLDML